MNDIKKTQHFSTNKDLFKDINFSPVEAVDPFAGICSICSHFPNTKWELYDIDVKDPRVNYRDSLLNPIDYTGKTVITNPPYLARNKTDQFKDIFDKYQTDDLYKAAILSIIGCENGILIIPVNFFTDEATREVREKFLSQYKVDYVNVFNYQVFENTSYNVCSFYFEKGKTETVRFKTWFENGASRENVFKLDPDFGYRLGGEFFELFKDIKPIFSRAIGDENPNTRIFVNCLDKKDKNFGLEYRPDFVYKGQKNDRIFATLKCEKNLTEDEQINLVSNFNYFIDGYRYIFRDLLFTNYRDRGRKRISLEDVYKICTYLIS